MKFLPARPPRMVNLPQVQKINDALRATVFFDGTTTSGATSGYLKLAREGYEHNTTVFACIREIVSAAKSIPIKLFTGPDKEKEITDHRLRRLIREPNQDQSWSKFLEAEISYYHIDGNSYWLLLGMTEDMNPQLSLVRDPGGILLLRPDRVERINDMFGRVKVFKFHGPHEALTFPPDRILHRRAFHPTNDRIGLSPLIPGSLPIDTDTAAQEFNLSMLLNQGRPSAALMVKGSMSPEERRQLEDTVNRKFSGMQNSGRILILEQDSDGQMEWKELMVKPKDMEMLKGRHLSKLEICQIFQVPPELIGDTGNKTYDNYAEARRAFYVETVIPYMNDLLEDVNRRITPLFGENLFLAVDVDDIEALQEARNDLWERTDKAIGTGSMTRNEARKARGQEESKDTAANELTVTGSTILLSDAVATVEPAEEEDAGGEDE